MKKIILMFILIISITLVGCNSGKIEERPETNTKENVNDEIEEDKSEEIEDVAAEEIPIHPDDIMLDITILEPDSIGNVYMEATFTNNSKYPITGYSAKVLLKDKNDTTYLSTYDTVMPGETSPKFESFGPETQESDDYEILTLEVTARTEDGNNLYIDYDFKLGEANWWEGSND
ncbi:MULTISPECIES: hypothetical protein [Schnuerera]|uniref:Uncharacterized protein n=1 Tax=[Clostridium] ultunense Esp TaxID=1288971 RepID=A0A1M4PQ15_9FIRM|nr:MULTISPECIES: hypothetical protein [Schnuerera]SHD77570.1 conserved exported protein of unknown function [[Clostridium] ultunense Esp]HSH36253.1 hypothetical protein [Schnuerera sp.]